MIRRSTESGDHEPATVLLWAYVALVVSFVILILASIMVVLFQTLSNCWPSI
jgi:hypothetical protein